MLKLFLCVTCILITTDVVQCKSEYVFNAQLPGWLTLHKIPATWEEAFLRCHFEGATMASPTDDNMTSLIHKIISESNISERFFLGTHALFSDGDFFSVEGVPLANMPVRMRNLDHNHDESWLPPTTEPLKVEPGACLTLDIDGSVSYVYTSSCTERHPYICYKKVTNETFNQCGTFDNNYRLNERTGSCYKAHHEFQRWSRANMICAAEGGYMVILNNEEETKFVKDMFPDKNHRDHWQPMHIGMRAWSKDRVWVTNHGERLEGLYNTWAQNQPDNHMNRQSCGAMLRSGHLDDVWCDTRAIFVCEKDPKRLMFEVIRNK